MKKILIMFAALIIISRVALAGGSPDPLTTVMDVTMKGKIMKVSYHSDDAIKVKVTIYDVNSNQVFSEQIKQQASFVRPYNFESLPFGEYKIVLEDENGSQEETVTYEKESAEVFAAVIKPATQEKCVVALSSKGEGEATVTILDEDKNILFSENVSVNGQALKLFDLRKIKGSVEVQVTHKGEVVTSRTISK